MEGYSSDKEQVEQLAKWWKENGKFIIMGLVIGSAVLFAWYSWKARQLAEAETASINFQVLVGHLQSDEPAGIRSSGKNLREQFPDSNYAVYASLALAKQAVAENDLVAANQYLQWVLDHTEEEVFRYLARGRMAKLYLDGADPSRAWSVLHSGETNKDDYLELKGDILLAQGKIDEAREYYMKALQGAKSAGMDRTLIQLKFDDLGPAPDTTPPRAAPPLATPPAQTPATAAQPPTVSPPQSPASAPTPSEDPSVAMSKPTPSRTPTASPATPSNPAPPQP